MTLHFERSYESHNLLSPLLLERGADAFYKRTMLDGVRCNEKATKLNWND